MLTLTFVLDGETDPETFVEELTAHVAGSATVVRYADRVMMLDENGVVIAWDTCGACMRHISRCSCRSGPVEPKYLTRWRHPEDREPEPVTHHETSSTTVEEKIEGLSAALSSVTIEGTK